MELWPTTATPLATLISILIGLYRLSAIRSPLLAMTAPLGMGFHMPHCCRYKPSIRRATRRVGSVVGRVDLMARFGPQVQ